MDRIPGKSVSFAPINQEGDKNKISKNQASYKDKKVSLFKPAKLFIKGLSKVRNFIMKPIRDRKITTYNQDIETYNRELKESRINKNLDKIQSEADFDMDWYDDLQSRMDKNNFDKKTIKDKNSDEIHEILLKNKIITPKESKHLKKENVDLEGSPYW